MFMDKILSVQPNYGFFFFFLPLFIQYSTESRLEEKWDRKGTETWTRTSVKAQPCPRGYQLRTNYEHFIKLNFS